MFTSAVSRLPGSRWLFSSVRKPPKPVLPRRTIPGIAPSSFSGASTSLHTSPPVKPSPRVARFDRLSIEDKRLAVGLPLNTTLTQSEWAAIQAQAYQPFSVAKLPLSVIRMTIDDDHDIVVPVTQEESSVVIGTAVMLRKFLNNLSVQTYGGSLKASQEIPTDLFLTSDMDGATMAEGICDIHKFSQRDVMRFLTDYKGKINALYAFWMAVCPSEATRLCDELMQHCQFKGLSYPNRTSQFGPLDSFKHHKEKKVLEVCVDFPMLKVDWEKDCDNPNVQKARQIIEDSVLRKPALFTEICTKLYLAVGLAAKRSIFYKGNTHHHLDKQEVGEGVKETFDPVPDDLRKDKTLKEWDPTSLKTLAAQAEQVVAIVYHPMGEVNIARESIVFAGSYSPLNARLAESILSEATSHIDTKKPVISGQVLVQQEDPSKLTLKQMNELFSNPTFQEMIENYVLATDRKINGPLSRLENRIGPPFYGKWEVSQTGRNTLVILMNMFTDESQGANRVNIAAQKVKETLNELPDFNARGGILTNWHSRRGATGELRVPLSSFKEKEDLLKKICSLSKLSITKPSLARSLNQAMVEFSSFADLVTGQDTRANITASLFQAYEPEPVDGIEGAPTFDPKNPSYKPLMKAYIRGEELILELNGPWASARTSVGRTVDKFGMVGIACNRMMEDLDHSVADLDRKTAIGVLYAGFEYFLTLAR